MPVQTKITFDDAKVKAAIERLRLSLPAGGDMTPMMTTFGRIIKTGTQLRFRSGESPEGVPWIPSRRVIEHGGKTLRLKGLLRNSITYQAKRDRVEVGPQKEYARIHQFGGLAGRGHRTVIPARPYLGASDADKLALVEAVNNFLSGAWSRDPT